eukprot:TRINITY_DN237_c0_g1_i1.p1 TRINITY_DN237_c0_g1~~TRINITY_DN237_c0_g1_i1.p1  ORF type:complete len:543 (-),score=130.22 TRINITY_DN237_c0_g1_i1:182-1810(-)
MWGRCIGRAKLGARRNLQTKAIPLRSAQRSLMLPVVVGLTGASLVYWWNKERVTAEEPANPITAVTAGAFKDTLPTYTQDDVAKHRSLQDRIWVTYREGVYDITDFVESHPGGARILLAAGGAIDPFWSLYGQHKTDEVAHILESMRIGNLKLEAGKVIDDSDPYAHDPSRHPSLLVRTNKPFNAEAPNVILNEYITPNDLFYVRNHLPVPDVDPKEYVLEVSGEGLPTIKLTLEDLKKLPQYTVAATIQCAGQRRNELKAIKPVRGLDWDIGAISNATWTGCRLADVLELIGLDHKQTKAQGLRHVCFEGLDRDSEKNYSASIPIEKALDERGDVLLAWDMNGVEIPRDHGFPIRAVVPGVVGARNVKWLGKVHVTKDESFGHWQRNDYKGFGPNIDWDNVDFHLGKSIQELPVTSAITEPVEGQRIDTEEIVAKGFAWSGGGRDIYRVDVSTDGGKTWTQAEITKPQEEEYNRAWSWSPWTVTIPVTKEMEGQKVELCVKAVNSAYDSQPEKPDALWNLRGVLSNAWHRVNVVIPKEGEE